MRDDFQNIGTVIACTLISDNEEQRRDFIDTFFKTFNNKFPDGYVKVVKKKYGVETELLKVYRNINELVLNDREDKEDFFFAQLVRGFDLPLRANMYLYRFRQRGVCLKVFYPEYPVGLCLFFQNCKKTMYDKQVERRRENYHATCKAKKAESEKDGTTK